MIQNRSLKMKRKGKVIPIHFSPEIYYKLKEEADREHLPLSTWIRKILLHHLNKDGKK